MVRNIFEVFGFNKKKFRAANLEDQTDIANARYVVIDTELTGLNEKRDSIVSLGAVRMTGGRIELGECFYQLVNPEAKFTAESVVIHGITPSDVKEKPAIDAVLSEFLGICSGAILIGHCISIDLSFLNREIRRIQESPLQNAAVDTSSLCEWLRRRASSMSGFSDPLRDCSLYGMAKHFGIPVNGAHNAIMDAYITAQLFQRLIPILLEAGVRSTGELLRVGHPSRGGDRYRSGEWINF